MGSLQTRNRLERLFALTNCHLHLHLHRSDRRRCRAVLFCMVWFATAAMAQEQAQLQEQQPPNPHALAFDVRPSNAHLEENPVSSSSEQGQVLLPDAFELDRRQWRLDTRKAALEATQFKLHLRSFYFSRDRFDNTKNEAMAIGGWAGFKTGYFLDHFAFGATVYTSQHLHGDDSTDGTQILATGQEGYTVLGEAYADIKIIDDLNLYVGRKEFDTPYINKDDSRMTPKTFEAILLQGLAKLRAEDETLKYGVGYFSKIKERNSDDFVSMSEDAGADIDRGVYAGGAVYKRGDLSLGAIDYFSPDVINIAYMEAKMAFPIGDKLKPTLALQYSDQRSTGGDALDKGDFAARQMGAKAELPLGDALLTAAYTQAGGDTNMQNPWSSYPGYTAVQVEDFNRDGEGAFMLRAAYELPFVKGLSTYALWVHGNDPDGDSQHRKDEVDLNVQWAPPEGRLKGLSLRVRYAMVKQHDADSDRLQDFRVILNYGFSF
jgi:hypothetical protein